jgi:hypothetical protein
MKAKGAKKNQKKSVLKTEADNNRLAANTKSQTEMNPMNSSTKRNPTNNQILAVIASCLLSLGVMADPVIPTPGVIPPNSSAYGKTYGEWAAAWEQWFFSMPVTASPEFDTADCSTGQRGHVWFLPGIFLTGGELTRNCTIPTGKALFFPVVNVWADNTGCSDSLCPPTTYNVTQLSAVAAALMDQSSQLSCVIDGSPVRGLANQPPYRVTASFSYTLPDDPNNVINWAMLNFCSATPPGCMASGGTISPAVTDGVYVMVAPLPPGDHTIEVSGWLSGAPFLHITYHLTVKQP